MERGEEEGHEYQHEREKQHFCTDVVCSVVNNSIGSWKSWSLSAAD